MEIQQKIHENSKETNFIEAQLEAYHHSSGVFKEEGTYQSYLMVKN